MASNAAIRKSPRRSKSPPRAGSDLRELWPCIAFTVLISNMDDHLRNHGFLRTSTAGWTLSPAFDLNPNPEGERKHLATAIDERNTNASLGAALQVAELFGLDEQGAQQVIGEVLEATDDWREAAGAAGLGKGEIERMEPAFEHKEREFAGEVANQP